MRRSQYILQSLFNTMARNAIADQYEGLMKFAKEHNLNTTALGS